MKLKDEVAGSVVTVAYLVGVVVLVYMKRESLPDLALNSIGDFLAGVFGPIAFLWLVLGYRQQGRELKLSSEALRMQADELKQSVEQQTIMANAAVQQIESQRAALEFQQREFERSISPAFRFESASRGGGTIGGPVRSVTRLINSGKEVSDVLIVFEPPIGGNEQFVVPIARNNSTQDLVFNFDWPGKELIGVCAISYIRSDAKRVREEFLYSIPAENPYVRIDLMLPEDQATLAGGLMAK